MMFFLRGRNAREAALHMWNGKRKKYSGVDFKVEVSLPLYVLLVSQFYQHFFKTAAKKKGRPLVLYFQLILRVCA